MDCYIINKKIKESVSRIAEDIKKGDFFTEQNLGSVRPEFGMHPKYIKEFLSKETDKYWSKGERFIK